MATPAEQALDLKNQGNAAIAKKDWAVCIILVPFLCSREVLVHK
jgi:hypothetical protein